MTERLRIFLSSPGDVTPERTRAALIIGRLAKEYGRFFSIEPYLWEYEPMLASGTFQDLIEPPSEADIVLVILWSRLGTNLPEQTAKRQYRGLDGRAPVTGTEWEFENALAANRVKHVPDLLVYRKTEDPQVSLKNQSEKAAREAQWTALEEFWRRYFADKGEFKAAFSEFAALEIFEQKLESDLRHLIEGRIKTRALAPLEGAIWLKGNPFRGLESYGFEDAPIFFGRARDIQRAVESLAANAASGRSFLLILGASGAGKSSLAQAGIVPALFEPGVVSGVGIWRRAVMRPANLTAGPFASLAAALVLPEAIPELLAPGQTKDELAGHLAASLADPSFPIVSALARVEAVARDCRKILAHEEARLVLVVDQLEELFTAGQITPEQQRAFIRCLEGMTRSRRVVVIATMRSDHWHRASETPVLIEMSEGTRRLDLLSPGQAEILEMIRRPAQAAGLSFDRDPRSEISLDAELAEEAATEPGSLPLLSYLLGSLYQLDIEKNDYTTLTSDTAHELGGLKGAIAARAESVLLTQPPNVRAELPALFQILVQSRLGEAPTARTASLEDLEKNGALSQLVDAFLAPGARLLITGGDENRVYIRLAHEALLDHWERAVDWLRQNRRDLETRARLEEAESLWSQSKDRQSRRRRLLTGLVLAEGRDLVQRWGDAASVRVREFVRRSESAARTTTIRYWGTAFALFLILSASSFVQVEAFDSAIRGDFDDRLRIDVNSLVAAYEPEEQDYTSFLGRFSDPRFERAYSGWYWQVTPVGPRGPQPNDMIISRSLFDRTVKITDSHFDKGVTWGYGEGPDGQQLRFISQIVQFPVTSSSPPNQIHAVALLVAAGTERLQAELTSADTTATLLVLIQGAMIFVVTAILTGIRSSALARFPSWVTRKFQTIVR